MSDIRVALVAEGLTDAVIIEAALKALLPRAFVLTLVQPEAHPGPTGAGWGGVLRWCYDFSNRGIEKLEDDPTLPDFDLFVIQADSDISGFKYADVGPQVAELAAAENWPALPASCSCPPATGCADAVRACLLAWTRLTVPGERTVLCVPAMAPEAWIVAAVFRTDHTIHTNLECNRNLGNQLANLSKKERIKKRLVEYRTIGPTITAKWTQVRAICTEAERFSQDVQAIRY
jgi:hypothetical protein